MQLKQVRIRYHRTRHIAGQGFDASLANMPTAPQSVALVIAIVDRPRRPGRNDQHVQGLFYTPAENGGRLDRRDIQEARGFQGHRLQVSRDGGSLAK